MVVGQCCSFTQANAKEKDIAFIDANKQFNATNDGIWQSAEDAGIPCENSNNNRKLSSTTYPSSVDNSKSIYFPNIKNQGNIGSCVGWATTYYQYTYEVNKMLNIPTTDDNAYSPAWTYNYVNGGCNQAARLNAAYEVLKNQGAMKLKDFPHPENLNQYSFSWSTETQKMVDALRYRAKPNSVNCESSTNLDNINEMLSKGKIGVIWTDPDGWIKRSTTDGESIIVRGTNCSGGHFMTIVGYDDSIKYIVNKNGLVGRGAFKLANSKGENWENNGYIWVAYDALNSTSLLGNWDSTIINRQQIFGDDNEVYFIDVKTFDNYYVGKVEYNSNDPWHCDINGSIGNTSLTYKFQPSSSFKDNPDLEPDDLSSSQHREIVFDYFDYLEDTNLNVADYITSKFTTKIKNPTSNITNQICFSVIDNRCKTIKSNNTATGSININGGSYSRSFILNLKKGKISSYNSGNITSSDISALSLYLVGGHNLSSLQQYLADMNNDSVLNSIDLSIMIETMNKQNKKINVLNLYMPELGTTVREFITSQYGETFANEVEMRCVNATR